MGDCNNTENMYLIGTANSAASKTGGQKHRSSDNFAIVTKNDKKMLFCVTPSNPGDTEISFNVMKDNNPLQVDDTKYKDVKNGTKEDAYSSTRLYIADPSGASAPFVVNIYQDK